ncbi:hypothetical protein GBA52_014961 [Prunus armeniaca]|nr:hypothetical protein GBA52_014961 [Prunus armeniaca]
MVIALDEETSFIEVVPMGVYYNISKFRPKWINLEPSARQRLNQVHRNVMLAAITFNVEKGFRFTNSTLLSQATYEWPKIHSRG